MGIMRKLLLLFLAVSGMAYGQFETSIGYMVPLDSDYGKGYATYGYNDWGVKIAIGGDSKIAYGGEKKGKGYLDLSGYRNFDLSDDWVITPSAGIGMVQQYEAVDLLKGYAQSDIRAQHKSTNSHFIAGLTVGWKFLEITYTTDNEIALGFKLKR